MAPRVIQPRRIEPAFDDRRAVRELIDRHAPYRAIAAYIPDAPVDELRRREAEGRVPPWFRGTWAVGGRPLVDGAGAILGNRRFVDAARRAFETDAVRPQTVVVNVTAPMPAGAPHVDIPTFRGATRELLPARLLIAMGASGLFERWRVIEAGVITWFYDGPGGAFEYWPDGLDGPVLAEGPPFGNVALVTDSDRMFHRIGAVGAPEAAAAGPRMTGSAEIRPDAGGDVWRIVDDGRVSATLPTAALRFSILWKAEIGDATGDRLDVDRIVAVFDDDLRRRGRQPSPPSAPLHDDAWLTLIQRTYDDAAEERRR